jgi:hypothetical protein
MSGLERLALPPVHIGAVGDRNLSRRAGDDIDVRGRLIPDGNLGAGIYSALIFFLGAKSTYMHICMAHAVLHNHGLANPVDFHNTRRLLLVSRVGLCSMTSAR